MPRTFRVCIAPNQYRDAYGIDTIVKYRGEVRRDRWPLDSDPHERAAWVLRAKADLHDRAADAGTIRVTTRGTLRADAAAYLAVRAGRPSHAADTCHMAAWIALYGARKRSRLVTADINRAIAQWRTAGVAPQTIRHRCRVFRTCCRFHDGPTARTPVDGAAIPKRPKPHPVGVPLATIRRVAANLARWCDKYRTRREPTYARFLVLATTLQRPIQLEWAKPADVDLERRVWLVRAAKNAPGNAIYLNDDMLAAWRLFIRAGAWGAWNRNRYRTALHAAGWPRDVSTYNYRHAGAIDALDRGADLRDIQALLGHADITTTARNYAVYLTARQQRVSTQLAGRLPEGHPAEGHPAPDAPAQTPDRSAHSPARRKRRDPA